MAEWRHAAFARAVPGVADVPWAGPVVALEAAAQVGLPYVAPLEAVHPTGVGRGEHGVPSAEFGGGVVENLRVGPVRGGAGPAQQPGLGAAQRERDAPRGIASMGGSAAAAASWAAVRDPVGSHPQA